MFVFHHQQSQIVIPLQPEDITKSLEYALDGGMMTRAFQPNLFKILVARTARYHTTIAPDIFAQSL